MANITLNNDEIVFLRQSILEKYCNNMNENPKTFIDHLTGTIKYYEAIADNITDYINEQDKIVSYMKFLLESPFKMILRKWLEENERMRSHKKLLGEPAVSANIIRKLIFYGHSKTSFSFKDYFVLACYIYIGIDRSVILKKLNTSATKAKNTLNPIKTENHSGNSDTTISPFEKKIKCSLTPLDSDNNPARPAIHFTSDEIMLNRTNLDPGNITITSKIQAKIKSENGKWQLMNESELKTTYIQVTKPYTLEKGDIIVFGNQRFLFDETD